MSYHVRTVEDVIVGLLENISTSNTLNGIAYNTTIKNVARQFIALKDQNDFPSLALVDNNMTQYVPKDTVQHVWKTFVPYSLYGYVKSEAGLDSSSALSYLKLELNKLEQDVARVLLNIGTSYVAATPRWMLTTWDDSEKPQLLTFHKGYDVQNTRAAFVVDFKVEFLWHDKNLQ